MLTPLTPPDGDTILPIEDARAALNIIGTDHDARITMARNMAIEFAEAYSGLSFLSRQFQWTVDRFSASIDLPRGPVVTVDSIDYRGSDGGEAVLADTDWYLAAGRVTSAYGATWPAGDHVRIVFTAGYAAEADIPYLLKAGMIVAMAAQFADAENPDLSGAQRCLDLVRGAVL